MYGVAWMEGHFSSPVGGQILVVKKKFIFLESFLNPLPRVVFRGVLAAMGIASSKPSPSPLDQSFTPTEMERLLLLADTAGVPSVVEDAVRSGDIMNPAHMLSAKKVNDAWEEGVKALKPYAARQERVDKERAQLRKLGEKMGGVPAVRVRYAAIRERLGPLRRHQGGDVLRIQTPEHGFVDMELTYHSDSAEDCVHEATHHVPQFSAFIQQQEPVLIFEHDASLLSDEERM
jgi:hypothetical protein